MSSVMQNNITLNNRIKLLLNGSETFRALKDALTKAEHCINLEYFSFHDDETGNALKDILAERSRKGVKVRMIIDAVGSWRLNRKFIRGIEASGIEFRMFRPFSFHRDHRKIITVDGTTGFLGGFNIGDVYLRQWRDTHLKIYGGAVSELDRIFSGMWGADVRTFKKNQCSHSNDDVPVRIMASGKGGNFRAIADEYIRIIKSAKKRIWITTPYFAPDEKFINALISASSRGADVRIIIPSGSNHMFISWASQSYIDPLINSGIKIFTYQDRFIHAKTMIADDHVASVGTANLDALSFEINYEVQAFVYSTKLVKELEAVFVKDLENCAQENIEIRKKRPLSSRLKEGIGRLLSPML